MLSCDTMAVAGAYTEYGKNMLAKNSDRPTGESQRLIYFPARKNEKNAKIKMTDLEIDDIEETYALIGSQPYWTWGFEMGYNECGLMIGNEAQGSKNAEFGDTGILGLDLLRLALERAATARDAIDVITSNLRKYGQNANASQLTDRRYENSYLIIDKNEIWLLETAGREWVAKRIKKQLGISNCYCVETDFELSSDNAEAIARKNKWLAPDEDFNFAKAYTKPAIRQTLAVPRMRRLNKLLAQTQMHSTESLKSILRDHFDGEITDVRFGKASGTFFSICMHMREWGESETTASLISRIDDMLGVVSRWAPAQPCQSLYLPIYFTGYIPKALTECDKNYSSDSLWWQFKKLSLIASVDDRFEEELTKKLKDLEAKIEALSCDAEENAKELIKERKNEEANVLLNSVMDKALELAEQLCVAEIERIKSEIDKRGGIYGPEADNVNRYCEYTGIRI